MNGPSSPLASVYAEKKGEERVRGPRHPCSSATTTATNTALYRSGCGSDIIPGPVFETTTTMAMERGWGSRDGSRRRPTHARKESLRPTNIEAPPGQAGSAFAFPSAHTHAEARGGRRTQSGQRHRDSERDFASPNSDGPSVMDYFMYCYRSAGSPMCSPAAERRRERQRHRPHRKDTAREEASDPPAADSEAEALPPRETFEGTTVNYDDMDFSSSVDTSSENAQRLSSDARPTSRFSQRDSPHTTGSDVHPNRTMKPASPLQDNATPTAMPAHLPPLPAVGRNGTGSNSGNSNAAGNAHVDITEKDLRERQRRRRVFDLRTSPASPLNPSPPSADPHPQQNQDAECDTNAMVDRAESLGKQPSHRNPTRTVAPASGPGNAHVSTNSTPMSAWYLNGGRCGEVVPSLALVDMDAKRRLLRMRQEAEAGSHTYSSPHRTSYHEGEDDNKRDDGSTPAPNSQGDGGQFLSPAHTSAVGHRSFNSSTTSSLLFSSLKLTPTCDGGDREADKRATERWVQLRQRALNHGSNEATTGDDDTDARKEGEKLSLPMASARHHPRASERKRAQAAEGERVARRGCYTLEKSNEALTETPLASPGVTDTANSSSRLCGTRSTAAQSGTTTAASVFLTSSDAAAVRWEGSCGSEKFVLMEATQVDGRESPTTGGDGRGGVDDNNRVTDPATIADIVKGRGVLRDKQHLRAPAAVAWLSPAALQVNDGNCKTVATGVSPRMLTHLEDATCTVETPLSNPNPLTKTAIPDAAAAALVATLEASASLPAPPAPPSSAAAAASAVAIGRPALTMPTVPAAWNFDSDSDANRSGCDNDEDDEESCNDEYASHVGGVVHLRDVVMGRNLGQSTDPDTSHAGLIELLTPLEYDGDEDKGNSEYGETEDRQELHRHESLSSVSAAPPSASSHCTSVSSGRRLTHRLRNQQRQHSRGPVSAVDGPSGGDTERCWGLALPRTDSHPRARVPHFQVKPLLVPMSPPADAAPHAMTRPSPTAEEGSHTSHSDRTKSEASIPHPAADPVDEHKKPERVAPPLTPVDRKPNTDEGSPAHARTPRSSQIPTPPSVPRALDAPASMDVAPSLSTRPVTQLVPSSLPPMVTSAALLGPYPNTLGSSTSSSVATTARLASMGTVSRESFTSAGMMRMPVGPTSRLLLRRQHAPLPFTLAPQSIRATSSGATTKTTASTTAAAAAAMPSSQDSPVSEGSYASHKRAPLISLASPHFMDGPRSAASSLNRPEEASVPLLSAQDPPSEEDSSAEHRPQ